jgi:hypothetical protein
MKTFATGRLFLIAAVLILGSGALLGGAAAAHHSFTAEFDREQPITLTGIVYKVDWTNPHVWFYINVFDEDTGEVESWGVELAAPAVLQGRGWGPDSLTVGEEVTVDGWKSRNGLPRINSRQVVQASTGRRPGESP